MKYLFSLKIDSLYIPVYKNLELEEFGVFERDGEGHRIQIRGMQTDFGRHTLLHEALHAVADLRGVGLSERQVRNLELGLMALLRENPQLKEVIWPNTQGPQGAKGTPQEGLLPAGACRA